jgi:ribonuclease E
MSRQRLRPSLGESSYHTCPRCSGFGTIRSVESLALAILRIVGEEARKERTVKVIAQLPVEVATYLLNEKRDWVQSLEARHDTQVILVANSALETPHYDVRRVRDDQAELPENAGVSYALAEAETEFEVPSSMQERTVTEQAAIGKIEPATPAPRRPEPPKPGFWDRLKALFAGDGEEADTQTAKAKEKTAQPGRRSRKSGEDSGRERSKAQRGRRSETRKDEGPRSKKKTKTKKKTKKKAKRKTSGTGAAEKKQDKPQSSQAADSGKDESRDDGRHGSRTRRSRGGRRRRRTTDKASQDAQQPSGEQAPAEAGAADKRPAQAGKAQKPDGAAEKAQAADSPAEKPQAADKPAAKPEAEDKPAAKPEAAEKPKAEKPEAADRPAEKPQAADKPMETGRAQDRPAGGKAEPGPDKRAESEVGAAVESGSANREPQDAERSRKSETKSGNGSDEAKPAAKPEGRLLPWEPAHLPAEIKKEEPSEPQRDAEAGAQGEPPRESG